MTNGAWNRLLSFTISLLNGKYPDIKATDNLFNYTETDVSSAVNELKKNGYCVLKQRLPDEIVERLMAYSLKTPVRYVLPTENYSTDGIRLSQNLELISEVRGKAAKCNHETKTLLQNPDIKDIILDPFFLSIAQEYLGAKPIMSNLEMWWSFPVADREKFTSASAQKYHFDMDQVKFFNFFFYLTDVDTNNGPHCYVKGSHKTLPSRFRRRGRFSDQDVKDHYPADDIVEITGKKGTIIAVDTRGIHKGKALENNARLLMQVRFTNSLFGQQYPTAKFESLPANKRDFVAKHFDSYFNYL